MASIHTFQIDRRELARRSDGGVGVTLIWNSATDTVSVQIHHAATDERIEFGVARASALDAFHHPFAYLLRPDVTPGELEAA